MGFSYKFNGKSIDLEVDPHVVAVRLDGAATRSVQAASVEAAGAGPFSTRTQIPGERYVLVPVEASAEAPNRVEQTIEKLGAQDVVESASPVFRIGSNRVIAPDRVIVGLKEGSSVDAFAERHKVEPLENWGDSVLFQLNRGTNCFAFLEDVDGDEAVQFAEPDFVTLGKRLPRRGEPATPMAVPVNVPQGQYAMDITQARDAWALQAGDPSVSVAVLDEGVDTGHADLSPILVGTYDATDNDEYQEPNYWDGHGTACAGLAVATPNQGDIVSGAGRGCSLYATRIAYSEYPGGPWITRNSWIVRAIQNALKNGASVLSNSWGGGLPSEAITQAFEEARTSGRDGLGCVIVVAAGNDFSPVDFPGELPNVLTVSATNEYDEAKTPTSGDGEHWWGTNHGDAVDVGAPGVHNLTTDNRGAAGYDPTDYDATFNGTSSACPIVAGACALLISADPGLSEAQVRDYITQTADKVGQFPYQDGRNDFFGYGRLNVLKALQAVQAAQAAP